MSQVFWVVSKPVSCQNCGSKSIYETTEHDGWTCLACSRIYYLGREPSAKLYRDHGPYHVGIKL